MEKQTDEFSFMATLDDSGLCVTDSCGGGHRVYATTRDEAADEIERYIQRCARMFAEDMADDLFDEDSDDENDDD